jgi:hypothetical protein
MQWYQPTDDPEKDTVAVKDYLAQLFTDLSKEALRRVE